MKRAKQAVDVLLLLLFFIASYAMSCLVVSPFVYFFSDFNSGYGYEEHDDMAYASTNPYAEKFHTTMSCIHLQSSTFPIKSISDIDIIERELTICESCKNDIFFNRIKSTGASAIVIGIFLTSALISFGEKLFHRIVFKWKYPLYSDHLPFGILSIDDKIHVSKDLYYSFRGISDYSPNRIMLIEHNSSSFYCSVTELTKQELSNNALQVSNKQGVKWIKNQI